MKLSRALKLKKQLAGEVAKLQRLIREENVLTDGNKSRFDVTSLLKELTDKQTKLIDVKTKIAQGNQEIWGAIFGITELKGEIAFLRSLETKEGKFTEGGWHSQAPVTREYVPQFDKGEVEVKVEALEASIQTLQDEIDEYNQSHEVDIK